MLLCKDTVYFGVMDTLVLLPRGTKYKIQHNFLLRNNIFYDQKPHKKEQVEESLIMYSDLWNKAYSYSKKDTTTKVDHTIANAQMYFKQYEGKVIRSISFNAVDMFDGAVEDTTQNAITKLSSGLNNIHITTHTQVIRKSLRFKENDKIEAWRMSENERLLRQLKYIEDARIVVQQENLLSDSVDLVIITQDRFPFGLKVDLHNYDEYSISPYINNFLGLGHYLEAGVQFERGETPPLGYNIKYQANNLYGSFIDVGAYRHYNFEKNNYGLLIKRPFLTTDMRFGGSFSYENIQQVRSYDSELIDTVLTAPYHTNIFDVWLGKTFVLSNSGDAPNISIAARNYDEHYTERPDIKADSNLVFHDSHLSLASLMVQKINFFQTQKLAGFGITEDIPIGYSLKFTTGYNFNQYIKRPYIGFDFNTQLVRPKSGLLRLTNSIGVFYQDEAIEDTYANFGLSYYSPLKTVGRYEMRHMLFVRGELLINERYFNPLGLNNRDMGRIQPDLEQNSALSLQYKPVFHLPFQVLGFNFSAAPFTSVGFATKDNLYAGKSLVYSVHGITIRTKNESLIFPTIGLDVKYYPTYGSKSNQVIF
ncbi:MAG: hypothetical protein PF444_08435, partial [Bacteroidales bacterium]|nr:hypothetical protein [Bacteroidales bacterium]